MTESLAGPDTVLTVNPAPTSPDLEMVLCSIARTPQHHHALGISSRRLVVQRNRTAQLSPSGDAWAWLTSRCQMGFVVLLMIVDLLSWPWWAQVGKLLFFPGWMDIFR